MLAHFAEMCCNQPVLPTLVKCFQDCFKKLSHFPPEKHVLLQHLLDPTGENPPPIFTISVFVPGTAQRSERKVFPPPPRSSSLSVNARVFEVTYKYPPQHKAPILISFQSFFPQTHTHTCHTWHSRDKAEQKWWLFRPPLRELLSFANFLSVSLVLCQFFLSVDTGRSVPELALT